MTGDEPVARLLQLTRNADTRGCLIAGEMDEQLPFVPVRFFVVSNVPRGSERGGHAHQTCHQLLVAIQGSVLCEWEDARGVGSTEICEGSPALYLPPLVWAKQTYPSEQAVLLVLASHNYDVTDYIDDAGTAAEARRNFVGALDRPIDQ